MLYTNHLYPCVKVLGQYAAVFKVGGRYLFAKTHTEASVALQILPL